MRPRNLLKLSTFILSTLSTPGLGQVDADWTMNAVLDGAITLTDPTVGAAQGIARLGDYLYIYGDRASAAPRVGVIREYDLELRQTGRQILLSDNGRVIAFHPTGLTQHETFGTFFGDTVQGRGMIYRIDWQRALAQGDLSGAVLDTIVDDAAVNGTRPEFVSWQGRAYLATADYGDVTPMLRLMDPDRLISDRRSADAVVARVAFSPFSQTLFWDADAATLTTNRNVVAGLGWQVETFDLDRLLATQDMNRAGVRLSNATLPPHSELEGHIKLGARHVFVTSSSSRNIVVGSLRSVESRVTPRGYRDVTLPPDTEKQAEDDSEFVACSSSPPPLVPPGPGAGEWNSEQPTPQMVLLARSAKSYLSTPDPVQRYGEEATGTFRHYFTNSGEDYTIDLAKFLAEVPSVHANFADMIESAVNFAQTTDCEFFVSRHAGVGVVTREENENWFLAVNGYSYFVSGRIEHVGDNRELTVSLHFWDRYDWDPGVTIPIATPIGVIPVDQDTVGAFHRQGLAREFNSVGHLTNWGRWLLVTGVKRMEDLQIYRL